MSLDMSVQILLISKNFEGPWQYSIGDQLRRCALSIPSNIAEGAGRSNRSFAHFLDIAIGSSFELETQLIMLKDLHLLKNDEFDELLKTLQSVQKNAECP
jgi:four helix bundle protein